MKHRIKSLVKNTLGETRHNALLDAYYQYHMSMRQDAPLVDPPLNDAWAENVERFKAFKAKHRGERCVIIGNGPSIANMDLSLIKDEVTFGTNRIYLNYEKMGFEPTYYVSVNKHVIEQFSEDIMALSSPKFINHRCETFLRPADDIHYFIPRDHVDRAPFFAHDLPNKVCCGGTVTHVALQLAYYMGFSCAVLIGVDHSFSTEGPANTLVTSQDQDPNHFHPDYFGKGVKWQLPDLERSEMAYNLARYQYALAGREILDATVGGKLDVFPKVNYEDLFKS
jgi:hypothetical protein